LGNKENTVKNPFLMNSDETETYQPAYNAEGIYENYSRKNYKQTLEFLNCAVIIGIYDNYGEMEKISKSVKPILGKNVKSLHYFGKNNLIESEDYIKLLISKSNDDILICYTRSMSKNYKLLSIEKSDRIKILELD